MAATFGYDTKLTYAETTTQARSVVPEFDLLSWEEVPFLKLISGGDEKRPSLNSLSAPCRSMKYEWMEDQDFSLKTTLSAAIASTGATSCSVATADGARINPEMILKIDDEYVWVTANDGAGALTITRGFAGTTAATHADASVVTVVGRAHKEGADAPKPVYSFPDMPYNLCQQFVDTILFSDLEQAIDRYGIDNAVEYETEKRTRELYRLMERTCFYGLRTAGSGSTPSLMGGLKQFIPGANKYSKSSNALTIDYINEAMRGVVDVVGRSQQPNTFVCNTKIREKLTKLYAFQTGVTNNRTLQERNGGTRVDTIINDWGEMDILVTPWVSQDELYLVRKEKLGFGPLADRVLQRKMIPTQGTSDKWMIFGTYTFEVRASASHALIYGTNLYG
jgi:hypothetical protein